MNGLLTLVIIVAVYLPVMVIFAALRAMQGDINEIYSRVFNQNVTLEMILRRVTRPEPEISAVAEAYEQGKKDARMWTPTAEILPPLNMWVLVSSRLKEEFTVYLSKGSDGVYQWYGIGKAHSFEYIKAWQKLPEPYTGENDETEHEAEENEK